MSATRWSILLAAFGLTTLAGESAMSDDRSDVEELQSGRFGFGHAQPKGIWIARE